jgi:DNA-binding MarR family transcriptional regulator
MPEETTQLGIAKSVDINYSHVPRAVKRLENEGYIKKVMAHSMSNPTGRRRKAYYLTEFGLKTARDIMDTLMRLEITVEINDRKPKLMTLIEIRNNYEIDDDILELYEFVIPENKFDINLWENRMKVKQESFQDENLQENKEIGAFLKKLNAEGIILNLNNLPVSPKFINREKDQKEILDAINDKEIEIIILNGPIGIGKRTLIANVLSKEISKKVENEKFQNIIWIEYPKFQSEDNRIILEGNLELFMEYLSRINGIIVFNQIFHHSEGILSIDEIDDISNMMSELNKNHENNNMSSDQRKEFKDFLAVLIRNILTKKDIDQDDFSKVKKPKLILISTNNSIPKFVESIFNERDIQERIKSINLTGLNILEINTLLDSKYSSELINALYYHTKGNPGIINCIKMIDDVKLKELIQLPPEEASLGLILIAQKIMEERKDY